MTPPRWLVACALVGFVLAARHADAQVLTGDLLGTVTDESGGVLPGASIELSSPALIGGPSTAVADEKGTFRFVRLAPGEYTLEIELGNFARYREDGIQVAVQSTIERSIVLKLAGVAESISVEAGSAVDAGWSGLVSRFDSAQLRSIPVRRFSMFDFIAGRGRVELLLDVLNALDNKAEERLADDNLFSQNFAHPSVFVDPRRAMLGVRLTFAR